MEALMAISAVIGVIYYFYLMAIILNIAPVSNFNKRMQNRFK
jgi:adenosine deaminase|tara:strand:+ start:128 stop:253 length:126 start_codon:yes stop_codon:yes gene_type:complete